MQCSFPLSFANASLIHKVVLGLETLGDSGKVVVIHVEIKSSGCCEWTRVPQTWLSKLLCVPSCTLLHTHTVIVLTCLWNSTGALLTSPLLSSLPPHLLLCSSQSFLPPPLREEKICHSLPSHCRMTDDDKDYPLTVTEKNPPPCWPWPLASLGDTKDGRKEGVLPQTWSWRTADDAARGCFGGVEGCEPQPLFQPAPSLSLTLSLPPPGCFPSLQRVLLRSRNTLPSSSSSFPALSGRVCLFVQTRWGLTEIEGKAFALLNWAQALPQRPK